MLLRSGELDQTRILRIMEVAPFFLPACNLSGGWKAWQRDICRRVEPELLFSISGFLHLEEVHLPYPAASVWVSWMEWRKEDESESFIVPYCLVCVFILIGAWKRPRGRKYSQKYLWMQQIFITWNSGPEFSIYGICPAWKVHVFRPILTNIYLHWNMAVF